jgi:outer membrane protein TolC
MRFATSFSLLVMCVCWRLPAQVMEPQLPRQAGAPVPASAAMPGAGQSVILHGVPSGKATAEVLPLTLSDAISRGLKYNLGLLTAEQGTRSAQASRYRTLSRLLPDVSAGLTEYGQQINLAAFGFSGFPGINPIAGPFSIIDARLRATQPILDLSALRGLRASSESVKAAQASYQDTRDIVVLAVANLYLQAVAGQARIEASRAQVATSQALYQRAVDMKTSGVAPGIDVLRAQVELQAQQQRLIFYQNEFEKQKLNLARAVGLPVGQQFRLADTPSYSPAPPLTFEQALDQAYRSRADYRAAQAELSAAQFSKKAAQAENTPSVGFSGDYGDIGPRIWNSHGTFSATVSLRIPVFQGERVRGDVLAADAALEQRKSQLEDLRAGIDYELRAAFLDLKSAGDQVQVAKSAVDLVAQQMEQAQDRFSAGVTNNIEVVQAQEAVATANENYISSLYAYNLAKATLARVVGDAEGSAIQFLGLGAQR